MTIRGLWYERANKEIATILQKLDSKDLRILEELDYFAYEMAHLCGGDDNTYLAGFEMGNINGYLRALCHVGLLTREERKKLHGYVRGTIYNYYKEHKEA